MRRSFIRYVARQAFGSKRLNRPYGRSGYGSLTSAYMDARSAAGGYLDQNLWEESYTEIIESQADKAGNAGQETLLGDDYFGKEAKEHCAENGKDYDPEKFVSDMQFKLGDDYFNAINIIIEECSEELLEAWDNSYGGDGMGIEMFRSNTIYGNYSNALSHYSARAAARYGSKWNTTAAARSRSSATAAKFLAKNPTGTSRTTRATPYAGRTAAESRAVSRATATRFLAKNPQGTARQIYP
jgi:hypothetical protein